MSEENPEIPPPAPPSPPSPAAPAAPAAGGEVPVLSYAASPPPELDWKTVWTARDYFEANLAVTKLQSQGIHARVDMEATDALGAWAGSGPGGARVQVLTQDIAPGKSVFEEIERERVRRQGASAMRCQRDGSPAKRVLR